MLVCCCGLVDDGVGIVCTPHFDILLIGCEFAITLHFETTYLLYIRCVIWGVGSFLGDVVAFLFL